MAGASETARPSAATLAAFAGLVVVGGLNYVAVRFSNQELDPLFGAGCRFLVSGLLFAAGMVAFRIPIPKGAALKGALLYGLLSFAAAYAFAYSALVTLSAAVAAIVMGAVPLITLLAAVAHKVETFTSRALIGASIAIAGIAFMVGAPGNAIAAGPLLMMVGAAMCASEAGVLIKRFPQSHPAAVNAIGMISGSAVLLTLSLIKGEQWSIPRQTDTWLSVIYLVTIGSIVLFLLYLFVLGRWTASGTSYMFVLSPVVASAAGAMIGGEPVPVSVILGGLIVVAGVYVGALSTRPAAEPVPEPAPPCP